MKICMIFVPLFLQDTPIEWMPMRVRRFSFFTKSSQNETNVLSATFNETETRKGRGYV